jgi:hypothetical protein
MNIPSYFITFKEKFASLPYKIAKKDMGKEIEIKTIEKYSYMLFSSKSGNSDTKAVIMLTAGNEFIGYINFMTDGCPLPETKKRYNLFYYYYHFSDMPVIVDMLRNEGPVYLFYMESNKENCRISTTMETVGEGEMNFK